MSLFYQFYAVKQRKLSLLILLFVFVGMVPATVLASDDGPYSLTGVVTDAHSGDGLAGAHVFVLESTVGTVTDEEGRFFLTDLNAGAYKLGISMLGYKPHALQIDVVKAGGETYEIELAPQVYELEQVTVTAKRNRRWKKQLQTFELQVIGDSENASMTKIVNPEVLNFIQRNGILIAEASEPLVIENTALGYRIHYTLVHCIIQQSRPQYKGIARFEEMEPKNRSQRRRWEKNREKAYKGSLKHLLRTLATAENTDEVKKEGFRIARVQKFPDSISQYERSIKRSKDTIDDLVQKTDATHENILQVNDYLLVTYARELESSRYVRNYMNRSGGPDVQRSSIELKAGNTVFHQNGFLYDAYSVVLHGYMGWERMAEMLPLDYMPLDG